MVGDREPNLAVPPIQPPSAKQDASMASPLPPWAPGISGGVDTLRQYLLDYNERLGVAPV